MSLSIRARLAVARHGLTITVGFLLLSALAMGVAWNVWTNPPAEVVSEELDVEEYDVESHTEAVVRGGNLTLYEPGERLVDMPVYFYDETPEVTFVVNTTVPDGKPVAVAQNLTVELEATRNDAPFFEHTRVIDTVDVETTDGLVTMRSTIDLREIAESVREARDGSRGIGSLQSEIVLAVSYESDLYSGEFVESTGIVVREQALWFDENFDASRTHNEVRTREVVHSPDMTQIVLFGGVGLLLLLIGAGLGWRSLEGFDIERLETELARSEFTDWISTGEIPTRAEKEYVNVVSLEDLVDIGIDSNKRVIYDESIDAYAVVDADIVYYYSPGEDEIHDWLDV